MPEVIHEFQTQVGEKHAAFPSPMDKPMKVALPGEVSVNESLRRVISKDGFEQKLTGVKSVNNTGSWDRFDTDQGYVVVNKANVLMYIIRDGKQF